MSDQYPGPGYYTAHPLGENVTLAAPPVTGPATPPKLTGRDAARDELIQQARETAERYADSRFDGARVQMLARAVLALTEQQPEPVSRVWRDELIPFFRDIWFRYTDDWPSVVDALLAYYRVTKAKPGPESATDPDALAKVKELAEVIDDAMDTSVRAHGQIPNWRWDGPLNAADAVLSRYTITRKQPEGADHGE